MIAFCSIKRASALVEDNKWTEIEKDKVKEKRLRMNELPGEQDLTKRENTSLAPGSRLRQGNAQPRAGPQWCGGPGARL